VLATVLSVAIPAKTAPSRQPDAKP
jgi:hypothetical protein